MDVKTAVCFLTQYMYMQSNEQTENIETILRDVKSKVQLM